MDDEQFNRVVEDLRTNWQKAEKIDCVKSVPAFALYRTWRMYDNKHKTTKKGVSKNGGV